MQEYFTNLFDHSAFPLWSAFLLGVITSLGPCTLTTNIAAIGFISQKAEGGQRVLLGGLIYTLGRAFTYTFIAVILFFGANLLSLSGILSRYGEKLNGPLLVLVGLIMLDLIPIRFPSFNRLSSRAEKQNKHSYWYIFLLGVVFALAFCSYSGVMYFGLLIPMTINNSSGLFLPVLFALGTGLPVIIFAWLFSFGLSEVNKWFVRIKNFEIWLRRIMALIFIVIGGYQIVLTFILH